MKKLMLIALSLTCAAALSACATDSRSLSTAQVDCPQLPPPPASVMVPRASDFKQQMLNWCCELPATPTK